MSMDVILRSATTQAVITDWLASRGMIDAAGVPVRGFSYCWWAGSGKFVTALPVTSGTTIVTPPTFLPGFVMLAQLSSDVRENDQITNPSDGEQWSRSKLVAYVKSNGSPGSIDGISFYTISGVQLFRPADVMTWLATHGIPGHEWSGGNTF